MCNDPAGNCSLVLSQDLDNKYAGETPFITRFKAECIAPELSISNAFASKPGAALASANRTTSGLIFSSSARAASQKSIGTVNATSQRKPSTPYSFIQCFNISTR